MRRIPTHHRFTQWDGSQSLGMDADEILGAMANDLMEYGDLRWAMRNMLSRGMQIPQGGTMQGLRHVLLDPDRFRHRHPRQEALVFAIALDGIGELRIQLPEPHAMLVLIEQDREGRPPTARAQHRYVHCVHHSALTVAPQARFLPRYEAFDVTDVLDHDHDANRHG